MIRALCFLALILSAKSASAPFIKPCKNEDAACVTSSTKAAMAAIIPGISELGIDPMDPMKLAHISSDEGGLKIDFTDSELKGMKDCQLENVKSDLQKMRQSITLKCSVVLKGDYKLSGQLLILPVQGNGKYKIDIKDVIIKVSIDLTTNTEDDGKQHWGIDKWKHTYQVKTSTKFDFENLFNGNKALAQPVLEFANNNWREVMQEIAPPVVRAIVSECINVLKTLYAAVPADELYVA